MHSNNMHINSSQVVHASIKGTLAEAALSTDNIEAEAGIQIDSLFVVWRDVADSGNIIV